MANTIMSAKNSFLDGLLLDFSPENSKATSMTAALNATLVTFNGNELSLQNDMGNGRVETAFLPEGYIPVGTCEFGDIIYIVSYNPLTNKSLIGCFPSPERNISSEELGGLLLSLSWKDFQEGNDASGPTGELKASSVKKILYGNRDMTPGDKYIIYSSDLKNIMEGNLYNYSSLSDYGNKTHEHGKFPKLVKIHVVSIEESGKIVYLDSTTKWYDKNNYYINADLEVNGELKDLDSYRTMVSSAYSVFSSKVSGKLALLVELEKITGFSCSWEPYVNEEFTTNTHTEYDIYWNFNWTTDDNNINPDGAILLTSEWTGVDKNREGLYQEWVVEKLKIKLDKSWKLINSCPIAYNNNNYQYWSFSRQYKPENIINFDDFFNIYEYNKYLLTTITTLTLKGKLPIPYKLNINRNKGIPQISNYFVNCTSVIKDKYYTQNINGEVVTINPVTLNDDIVNNYFHYPVIKKFASFNIPTKQFLTVDGKEIEKTPNISNLIYHYEVAPTMPYGILREFTQEGYIDFSKIGTKSIALNTWKYYNYENTTTLTWGMEAYTEPGKGISEVVFEFYDNLGFVAAYHTKGKNSYNGVFTEYITLNESGSNYKLNNIPAFPEYEKIDGKRIPKPLYHKGLEVLGKEAVEGNIYLDTNGNRVTGTLDPKTLYWQDDSGTLYPNLLYYVKIYIKYCNKGVLDEYIEPESEDSVIIDHRWFWTNNMFNEYYYQVLDFKELLFKLNLNCDAVFEAIPEKWKIEKANYIVDDKYNDSISATNPYKSLSATVLYINQKQSPEDNIRLSIRTGLVDTYNTFNIDANAIYNKEEESLLLAKIYLAGDYIENIAPQPNVLFTEENNEIFEGIYPSNATELTGLVNPTKVSKTLTELIKFDIEGTGEELWNTENSYKNYNNDYKLLGIEKNSEVSLSYINSKLEVEEDYKCTFWKEYTNLSKIHYDEVSKKIDPDKCIKLKFSGIHYSKYYYYNTLDTSMVNVLRSFALDVADLEQYALGVNSYNKILYNKMYFCSLWNEGGAAEHFDVSIVSFEDNKSGLIEYSMLNEDVVNDDIDNYSILEGLKLTKDEIIKNFKFLFPMGFGYTYGSAGNTCKAMKDGDNNKIISSNRMIKENTSFSTTDLGGTIAAITSNGVIQPGDYMLPKNLLTEHIPYVLGYLTQLFYISDNNESLGLYLPYNYAYLEDNYSLYNKDIVINLFYKEPQINSGISVELLNAEINKVIRILGLSYYDYIDSLLTVIYNKEKGYFASSKKDIVMNDPNVLLLLENCLKTFPLLVKFNYIKPVLANSSAKDRVIVKSVFKNLDTYSIQNLNPNVVYFYDFKNKKFDHIRNGYTLRKILNYTIGKDQNTIEIDADNNTDVFYINKVKNYLTVDNGFLGWSSLPVSSTKTYSVKTVKAANHDNSASLTEFKSGLYFFNKV